jgi:hypothetical protein
MNTEDVCPTRWDVEDPTVVEWLYKTQLKSNVSKEVMGWPVAILLHPSLHKKESELYPIQVPQPGCWIK